MNLPKIEDYRSEIGASLLRQQEKLARVFADQCVRSAGFDELYTNAERFARSLGELGYPCRLWDQDGESLIIYTTIITPTRSIEFHAVWDDAEKVTVGVVFHDDSKRTEHCF